MIEAPQLEAAEGKAPVVSSLTNGLTGRVLLVVSDPMLRLNLSGRLRLMGFEVEVTSNGELAGKKRHSFHPNAVVLDLMVDDESGEEIIKDIRRDPGASELPIFAFSSAPSARATRRAMKAGATKAFTESVTPFDDIVTVLSNLFPDLETDTTTLPRDARDEPGVSDASLREAVNRMRLHLEVLARCKDDHARAAVYGELRGKIQPVLQFARGSTRHGLNRLGTALNSLLKVLHEMPECATTATRRTVGTAVDVMASLCAGDAGATDQTPLELTAVVADNDLVSRSVVCSALRSVGFKFECFAHPSVVLRYLDNNASDLVIVHLDQESAKDPEFGNKLRAKSKNVATPMILVSGVSDFESRSALAAKGTDELIAKPFIFMELAVKSLSLALKKKFPAPEPVVPASELAAVATEQPDAAPSPAVHVETESVVPPPSETASLYDIMNQMTPPVLPKSRFSTESDSPVERGPEPRPNAAGTVTQFTTLREELEKKRQEREKLVTRIFNNELELEQIRVALNEEKEHRQQLEQMVQDLMVGQAAPQAVSAAAVNPGNLAEVGAVQERSPQTDALIADFQKRLEALTVEADSLRESLAAKQKEREKLTTRIFNDERELDAYREALETERAQRELLATQLQTHGGSGAAPASPAQNDELQSLRQAQAELLKQLANAKVESEAEFKERAELEVRLRELTDELSQARAAQKTVADERSQLEAEVQRKLEESNRSAEALASAQREQAALNEDLKSQLDALRAEYAALEGRLDSESRATTETAHRRSALESQLAEVAKDLEQAGAARQRLTEERARLESELGQQVATLKFTAEQAESARREELDRSAKLQGELEQLNSQLTGERKLNADTRAQQAGLEDRLGQITTELEQSQAMLRQADAIAEENARVRQELETQLNQHRSELDARLSSQSQLSVEVGEQKAELERRLMKLEEELPLARQRINDLTVEKERVQADLTGRLQAAAQAASAIEEKSRQDARANQELEKELSKLRNDRAALDDRLRAEQRRADETEAARKTLEQRIERASAEIEQTQKSLRALTEERQRVEADLAKQLESVRVKAAAAEQDARQANARSESLTGELAGSRKAHTELEARFQAEQRNVQQALAAQTTLEQGLKRAAGELEQSRAAERALVEERKRVEADLTGKLNAAQAAANAARAEVQTVTGAREALANQLTRLRQVHEGLQAQLATEQGALAEARSRGDRLETRLAEAQVICEELRSKLGQEQELVARTAQEKAELESRIVRDTKAWDEARVGFEAHAAEQKRRAAELASQAEAAQALAAQAEAARSKESSRANRFESEVTQLWQVRDTLKAQVDADQKAIGELSQQRGALESRLTEANQGLNQTRGDLELLRTAKAQQDEQNRLLAERNQALQSEAALLADRQKAHETELSSMERRVRDSVASMARTTADLETERGERRRTEQRAAGLSAQLQELHGELNSHLQVEKENQARIAELDHDLAARVNELNAERKALENERGDRRQLEQRTAALTSQVELLRTEMAERLKLEKEIQTRVVELEQQLRVREESLVRVTQHLEAERGERRRVEQRAEALAAQTQELQTQLGALRQQDKEHQNRILQLEEQGGVRAKEIDRLQSGLTGERGERRKFEERAQALSVQLRELHDELNRHLKLEKQSQARAAELEQQLNQRQESLARLQANLEKESADRELAEEQVRAAGDISAKLQQYRASFEEARKAFEKTQHELETRLDKATEALGERDASLEQELADKARLQKDLEVIRRELHDRAQQNALELSKLQSTLQVESMERQRLEGDAMHSRYASLQSSRSGRALVNGFRRQLEQPVDQLMKHACQMLAFEMHSDLKQVAEALLESAVTLQNSVRECDVMDLAAADTTVPQPAVAAK